MNNFNNIDDRAVEFAKYAIKTGATVREIAKVYGISKSTVHKDLSQRLKKVNKTLAIEVKNVLELNKSTRHIRGGMATKNKYLKRKENNIDNISLVENKRLVI